MGNWIFTYCTSIHLMWSQLPCCTRKTSNILSKDLNWDTTEAFWFIVWSAPLLREPHDTLSLTFLLIIPSVSSLSPLSFFHLFYISCAQPLFSLFFSFAQLFSLRHTPPPKPSGCSHQGSGLSCIIIQPSRRAKVEGAKGKTASTKYQKESVSNIT